jgi:ribosome biogenesis GTPase / thiamine phosphate phosphatase
MIRNYEDHDIEVLSRLGWNALLQQQLGCEEMKQTTPYRVMAVHRGQFFLSNGKKEQALAIAGKILQEADQHQITVGDWLLVSKQSGAFVRLLERFSLIQRQAAGTDNSRQMVAANIDTMFIVSSCNADFNLSRLERYLSIAYAAEVYPVIVLTRQDISDNPQSYGDKARTLGENLFVEMVNAHDPSTISGLQDWCKPGQTIALVGSSGVGKSTLANTLGAKLQKTAGIREDDAKGRHTTTHRSLHPLVNGAVLLDSPGMRALGLADAGVGIATVFEDINELSQKCRFSNCQHDQEPGCAVKAAIENKELSQRRMRNYAKLKAEQERNTASIAERRKKEKATTRFHKKVMAHGRSNKTF